VLEWLPQESIFFDGADVQLRHEVTLADDASYLGGEILCFGRTAAGERFDTGRIAQHSTIRRAGRLIWFEQGVIAAGTAAMHGPLGLGQATVCATFIAVGSGMNAALVDTIRARLPAGDDRQRVGVSLMKHLLVARYLGHSSAAARQLLYAVWAQVRPVVASRNAVMPRIWNT
jgi:urease accessory protein